MRIFLECSEYPPEPHGGIGTLLVDRARSVNLDTPKDWSRAEAIVGALAVSADS